MAAPAQDTEKMEGGRLTVPLTHPGKPGKLTVGILHGSVTVTGHDGKEVEIEVNVQKTTGQYTNKSNNCNCPDDNARREEPSTEGLRKIPNRSIGLEVIENDNQVTVRNPQMQYQVLDLVIKVPKNFSLKVNSTTARLQPALAIANPKLAKRIEALQTTRGTSSPAPGMTIYSGQVAGQEGPGPGIVVEDLAGEVEIGCTNGTVVLADLSGPAVVNTVNGQIKAFFKGMPAGNMSFTTLNGSIDITLPASIKATAKIKSDRGDIFTDFDLDLVREQPQVEQKGQGKVYRIGPDNSVVGKINGGGPDIVLKNMNGNIYLRKQK
jgi:DUF4097 and DUF4098 domain-containing protein YvlB